MTVGRNTYCGCLYYAASALARKITRLAEKEFQPTGLAPSLAFIVMTVNRKPGITAGELSDIMQLQPSTVTRLVDKLEDKEYLRRHTEGKFMQVFPTSKATRLNGSLKSAWQSLYRRYTTILGHQSTDQLTAAIYAASSKLESD
jgi:MarR family transcriptional regulator, organic hydroperoxide resistance regulator